MPAISNELGMQLHDRWTRGQVLTVEEQEQLEVWYQQQDAEEAKQLNPVSTAVEISDLQAQVEMGLTQLATVIQQVRQITAENDGLRREISTLRQQLSTLKSA
jgi:predicted  nucleic acid-binding Zn-ribbon protein